MSVTYRWKEGFRAPRGVKADALWASLSELDAPTPEALFEASKSENHPLHHAIWSEPDEAWATRGRMFYCRKIIQNIERVELRGKKTITTRAAEFTLGRWVSVEDIAQDPDLRDAYLSDLRAFLDQASAKIEAAQAFLRKR